MADPRDRSYADKPEVAHETSDVNVKGIVRFAVALAIAALVIHIALYGLLYYYDQREARRAAPASPLRGKEEPPPEPRLQVAPRAELAEMRRAEEQLLHSYGWIDRDKNIVRVPIEEAMEIVVKKGLPVRKQTPQKSNESVADRKGREVR